MKNLILEDLKRIHELTYGSELLEQEGLLNKISNRFKKKGNDPTKADLVTDDVQKFFNDIIKLKEFGGISQQQRGKQNFQKNSELIQIALTMLGYDLPRFGVDGKFGPETANAVKRFKKDNQTLSESASELRKSISSLGINEKGTEISSGGEITTELSNVATKVLNDIKSKLPDLDIRITAGNDKYHKNSKSKHAEGKALDFTINPYDKNTSLAVNQILSSYTKTDNNFKYIDEYKNPSGKSTGGHFHIQYNVGESPTQQKTQQKTQNDNTLEKVTPEMLDKMIVMLKSKNITSNDLKKHIDTVETSNNDLITNLNVSEQDGFKTYSQIAQTYIDSVNPDAGISGEMIAKGASMAFEKNGVYVPPELSLSQLALEGGLSRNPNAKPIRTNNPYNVGNVDDGRTKTFSTKQEGINRYFDLISRKYIGKDGNVNDLLNNFVNKSGNRYASDVNYESKLKNIVSKVNRISKQFT